MGMGPSWQMLSLAIGVGLISNDSAMVMTKVFFASRLLAQLHYCHCYLSIGMGSRTVGSTDDGKPMSLRENCTMTTLYNSPKLIYT